MTTITDTQSARVLLDPDGQALDFTDINDLQLLIAAQINDLRSGGIPDALDVPTAPGSVYDLELNQSISGLSIYSDVVFTPRPGAGFFYPSGTARALSYLAGPIAMLLDDPYVGNAEAVAPFWLPGGADTLTTAVGDATNPRIDLVEIQLSYVDSDSASRNFEDATTRDKSSAAHNTRRRVSAVVQIKQGAASATPSYPACSAGFAPLCAIWIPATHNAVHAPENIRDMRWPLGALTVIDTTAAGAWLPGAQPWARFDGSGTLQFSIVGPVAGSHDCYFPCPITSKAARLVGIGVYGLADAGGLCKLVRVDFTPTAPTITELLHPNSALYDAEAFRTISAIDMMDEISGLAAESKGIRAANTRIGTPVWCNGYSAGPAKMRGAVADAHASCLALKFTDDAAARVHLVRWFIAQG